MTDKRSWMFSPEGVPAFRPARRRWALPDNTFGADDFSEGR
jgi:hypothetical protein